MKMPADQGLKMNCGNAPSFFFFFPQKIILLWRNSYLSVPVHIHSHPLWKTEAQDE